MKLPCPDPEGCKHFKDATKFQEEAKAGKALWVRAQKACKKHALRGDRLESEIERLKNCIECTIEDLKAWHCLSDDCGKRNIERFVKDLEQFKED